MKLREMRHDDVDMVRMWRNHPDVRRNMYTSHVISHEEHWDWWNAYTAFDGRRYLIAETDVPVGFVGFTNIHNGTANWAFYKAHHAPKGTGSQMERLALEYAFEELKLEKLSCEVLAYNKPVYYLHRKHGFQVEGIFRKAHLFEGERHDIYRMAIFKGDWKDASEQKWVGYTLGSDMATFTEENIVDFARLAVDENPIHFGQNPIVPGMLTGSIFSGMIAQQWPGAIYLSQSLNFRAPVKPYELLQVTLKCVSQIRRRLWLETTVTKGATRTSDKPNGTVVVEGEAVVLLP